MNLQAAHWSAEQQKALEDALRKHKAAGKDEKWDLIAGDVPGKTKADCVQRFKVHPCATLRPCTRQ
jgi:hypothetical protein